MLRTVALSAIVTFAFASSSLAGNVQVNFSGGNAPQQSVPTDRSAAAEAGTLPAGARPTRSAGPLRPL